MTVRAPTPLDPKPFERLLRPASVALFGGDWAENALRQCQALGFSGPLWPVHPHKDSVAGFKCYRSVAALPAPPDASFIGVNRFQTIEIVRQLAAGGAGGAVCFAAGFREAMADDPAAAGLQADLVAAAGAMPILGPNCYGLINYLDGAALWPDQHGGVRVARGVAIVSQSSNLAVSMTMQRRALPIAYMVTVGNQAQSGLGAVALGLLEDERVSALGLYVEGFGDLRLLEALGQRAHDLGKPIIALKSGRSDQSKSTAISHTASLAGSDAGADALLARLGIHRVHGLGEFLESLKLLHFQGGLPGGRLGSLSCSGGEASLIADAAVARAQSFPVLSFPAFSSTTRRELKNALGPLVHLANPLDYNTYIWGDRAALTAAFAAMLGAGHDLTLLILDFPRADRCDTAAWRPTLEAFFAAQRQTGAAAAVLATLPENLPQDLAEEIIAAGITPLLGLEDGLAAIEAAVAWGDGDWRQPAPLLLPGLAAGKTRTLDEAAAKAALRAHGVKVPASQTVRQPEDTVAAAQAIGFPVVLKALGVAHKSDADLVRLDLGDPARLLRAAAEMADLAAGYLVEKYVVGAVAELLIGVQRDPAHGFILTLAAGGVQTELLDDSANLLLPASRDEILVALRALRIWPLLAGYRGRPGADLTALVDTVLGVGDYVGAQARQLRELEINPYLALSDGGYAVDALIRMDEETS